MIRNMVAEISAIVIDLTEPLTPDQWIAYSTAAVSIATVIVALISALNNVKKDTFGNLKAIVEQLQKDNQALRDDLNALQDKYQNDALAWADKHQKVVEENLRLRDKIRRQGNTIKSLKDELAQLNKSLNGKE